MDSGAAFGSLFDRLFGQWDNGVLVYDIPIPFTALTERISAQLASDDGARPPLLQALIPLGRSLQRYAAEPDYFGYPRVIVAVDGEPTVSGDGRGLFLRDRLYMGYQEKAEAIEVISYNESAGRFEFQVVQNYGPGLTPTVRYASRLLCMGCHQNGGPIWSEPPWQETHANPRIAGLLQEQGRSFHSVPLGLASRDAETAFRIAASVDRANLLGVHQKLWQQACGRSARCRGTLLRTMLQYRLSGNRGYDGISYGSANLFKAGWEQRWPDGLSIQDARIPDRDPLAGVTEVAAELDPLEPRRPSILLKPSDQRALDEVIAGLAGFLPGPDIRLLDDHLFRRGQGATAARRRLTLPCAFTKTDLVGWAVQVRFSCGDQGGAGLSLDGQFYVQQGQATHGTIERMRISESEKMIKLAIFGSEIAATDGVGEAHFRIEQPIGRVRARLTDGHALEGLALRWDELAAEDAGPADELRRHPDNGAGILSIVDDFAVLQGPLAALVQQTENGASQALANGPLRGSALMRALFTQLGLAYDQDCCAD